MTALAAARILNGEGGTSASPAWLVIGDGRIVATGTGPRPQDAVDLGDALLAPGFVDIQVNGAGAGRLRDARRSTRSSRRSTHSSPAAAPRACRRSAARRSTRTPTMLDRLAAVRAARPDAVLGVHLEGPFLGGAPGAHPPELRPARRPRLARPRCATASATSSGSSRSRPKPIPDLAATAALARPRRRRRARPQHGRSTTARAPRPTRARAS